MFPARPARTILLRIKQTQRVTASVTASAETKPVACRIAQRTEKVMANAQTATRKCVCGAMVG